MSDQVLRQLERQWLLSKSAADEAALLLARTRAGQLTREQLELAAFAGREGARCALKPDHRPGYFFMLEVATPPWSCIDSIPLDETIQRLARWGTVAQSVAAVAAARAALNTWEERDAWEVEGGYSLHVENIDMSDGGLPRKAIEGAEAYLRCPCETHLMAFKDFAAVPISRDGRRTENMWWAGATGSVYRAARDVPYFAGIGWPEQPIEAILACAEIVRTPPVKTAIQLALQKLALG